jgi:hypothetical protein
MGKALRINFLKILVLFLALSFTDTFQSFGQVPLVDIHSFEISFTSGESSRERSGVRLSMQEAKRMSGLDIDDGQPFRFTSASENQNGFFYINTQGGESLGRYYHTSGTKVLSQLPIRNGTPFNISGVSIAFDFVYLSAETQPEIDYQLSYRVNKGEWISPSGGFFTSDFLQSEKREWSSFSMQIMLDQLYLLPNDQLDIRWTAIGSGDDSDFIPVALQKIELFTQQAEPKDVHPGSLIISEIMPAFETSSGSLEYIELYNSTENPINLKGLVLQSGDNRVVIQKNIIAKPYMPVVLAAYNRGDEAFNLITDYRYSTPLLGKSSGGLTLSFDGVDVARALFERSDPGTSVQMNSLENAFDGYSGLNHFSPATEDWRSILKGSPGEVSSETRLYSKTIQNRGWYLLDPPGQFSESLNRELRAELAPVRRLRDAPEGGNLMSPFIYYHPADATAVRLYATGSREEDSVTGSDARNSEQVRESVLKNVPLGSIRTGQASGIGNLINPEGKQAYPALLTWSESAQRFELIWQEQDAIIPWNSYLASGAAVAAPSDPDGDKAWSGLARSFGLSLVSSDSDSDSESIEYDRSLIGFWDSPSQSDGLDYSLPKLWSPISQTAGDVRDPLLFFKSADALYPASSYLNFPFTPDDLIQVSVGLRLPATVNRARFVWDEIDTLPDQWEIEFVDAELGERINMREEKSYSFSERSESVRDGMNDPDRSFQPVEVSEYSRFFIRVSSTGDLEMFETEKETPESIELKQNYPNPFNPTTTIGFYLPKTTDVRIGVFNVVGQQVGQLIDERLGAGDHSVIWNAMDMPSGVYIVQMEAMNTVQTRKITLIK